MKPYLSSLKQVCVATLLAASLGGCAATLIGGAAAVGATAIADRRSAGTISDDNVMEMRIKQQAQRAIEEHYQQNSLVNIYPDLNVTGYNRNILLLGQVLTEEDKAIAERIAKQETNVRQVYNYITVSGNARTFGDSADDTMITTRLRSRLLNVPGVYAGHVKVVTYNHVVYVMGLLTPEQQNAVTEVVRTTSGVQQVVTLYETYNP